MKNSMMMALALFVLGFAQAQAATLPSFDTAAYCVKVAESIGGSYVAEKGCLDTEATAKAQIEAREEVEMRILEYCEQVARSIGSSYVALNGCIEMEEEAREAIQGD
jgi:hypothetical protein